jgi:hypothetical protein
MFGHPRFHHVECMEAGHLQCRKTRENSNTDIFGFVQDPVRSSLAGSTHYYNTHLLDTL